MERESGSTRINPSWCNPRRYYLKRLRKQIEEVIELYIKNGNCANLVDVGCGNTPYKGLFSEYVPSYLGADLEENSSADIIIGLDGIINQPTNSVAVVLSTQVLEHVDSPQNYLSECKRIMQTDGYFILTTHGYWMYHPDPTDYWRWTSAGLKKIVSDAGFEILYFKGILGRSSMGLQLFHDGIYFKLPKFLKPVFTLGMQLFINIFDKINSQQTTDKDACTYTIVAKHKSH